MQKIKQIKPQQIIAYQNCEIQKNGTTTYQEWKRKATEFNRLGFEIHVSDLLEKETNLQQKKQGIDIADFFMKEVNET